MLKKTLFALFLLPLACDENPSPRLEDALEDVEFRNGPSVLYLSQYEFKAGADAFAKIAVACQDVGNPNVAVTFTEYPPEATGKDAQVIGLGFSTVATKALAECYRKHMLELGAHP